MIFLAFVLNEEEELVKKGKSFDKDREFTVVLEDLRPQFRVFGEGLDLVRADLGTVKEEVKGIKDQVGRNFEDITIIKVAITDMKRDITDMKRDIGDIKDNLKVFDKHILHLEETAK